MARFDRKVERQKKEFDFYHKEKTKKSKMTEFKENFSFRWIKINLRTVIYFRGNVIDCSIFSLKCKKYYNFMELTFTENNITYKVRPDN